MFNVPNDVPMYYRSAKVHTFACPRTRCTDSREQFMAHVKEKCTAYASVWKTKNKCENIHFRSEYGIWSHPPAMYQFIILTSSLFLYLFMNRNTSQMWSNDVRLFRATGMQSRLKWNLFFDNAHRAWWQSHELRMHSWWNLVLFVQTWHEIWQQRWRIYAEKRLVGNWLKAFLKWRRDLAWFITRLQFSIMYLLSDVSVLCPTMLVHLVPYIFIFFYVHIFVLLQWMLRIPWEEKNTENSKWKFRSKNKFYSPIQCTRDKRITLKNVYCNWQPNMIKHWTLTIW